jgi:uncharacterized protein YndB with AHSA1/START domain
MLTMPPVMAEVVIAAPPARVFAVITDLDAYPAWNRFTPWLSLRTADLQVGAELDLDCQMTDTELLRGEREVILVLDRARFGFCMGTSRTRGRPGIRSERWQRCEPLGADRTRFVNSEQFRGPLAPVVYLLYRRRLQAAFARYCADLKARVEGTTR